MRILDACCGNRMFWWDKNEPHTTYMDIRREVEEIQIGDIRKQIHVVPDVQADFTHMPFDDNIFDLVVWDPPHLKWAGRKSFMRAQYGQLPKDWQSMLYLGFTECKRVVKPTGFILFKWSEAQIKLRDVLQVFGQDPILGDKHTKTRWEIFIKDTTTLI